MKRYLFIPIIILSLFTGKLAAQCVSVRSNVTICQGSTLNVLGGALLNGTTDISWSDNGVGGVFSPNATTLNASWTPPGTYSGAATLTLTSTLGCSSTPADASFIVTVIALPVATFSYLNNPFCSTATNPLPAFTGGGIAGTFSSTSGLVFVSTSTGDVNLTTSTPGTYTVTNTIAAAGGCGIVTATAPVDITKLPVAAFSYAGSPYCSNGSNPLPVFSGGGEAGTFSSTTGLVFVNASTGQVNLTGSTSGTYTVKNTIPASGGCVSVTATSPVTITTLPAASISYAGAPFCKSLTAAQPVTKTGTTGGTYTESPAGLTINPSTGAITPFTSTPGIYTITYSLAASEGCGLETSTAPVTIIDIPGAPVPGLITQPTCILTTGSIEFTGLPSSGVWTITASPGAATISGTGATAVFPGISAGTYTYTVENSTGCISPPSSGVVISLPAPATKPVVGTITPPTCTLSTGSVVLTGLPPVGTWTLTRYPGTITTTGTGTSTTISGLTPNTYNYSVTNSAGCVSPISDNVNIPIQPLIPTAPVVGTLTPPTCLTATGSAALSGLPGTGNWTITTTPGGQTTTGTGTTIIITGIAPGTYTFTVTNSNGCISVPSNSALINPQPAIPSAPAIGTITQTTCSTVTGSVALSGLPATGTWTLTRNPGGVTTSGAGTSTNISGLPSGTFNFTITNTVGCTSVSSADVIINTPAVSPATPVQSVDCTLGFGQAVITVTAPSGAGLEFNLDGGAFQTSNVFNLVNNGSHYLSVRNGAGCTTTGALFSVSCGCINPPLVTLSSTSGSICGTAQVIISGNTFGGTATSVTITENGASSVTPSTSSTSPFSFTYTPVIGDGGKIVTITVTTNNPLGSPCSAAVGTYALTVNAIPAAPAIGTITNLTCASATGSVVLNGLPSAGTWTLTRSPGGVTTSGTGTSTTVTALPAGTYNFTVASSGGCTSALSSDVVINPQPSSPASPVIGTITQPTCATSTGSVILSGLPSPGTWTLTRNPGGVTITSSGTSSTISTLLAGTYTFTVTNSAGCISPPSGNVQINAQPTTPAAPSVGKITPPTCTLQTGSVVLLGLPSTGGWTLTRYPGTITTTGNGTNTTLEGLSYGTYNFTVTTSGGCLSVLSLNVIIPEQPPMPPPPIIGTITQPTFAVPTGSVLLNGLPSSGAWVITRLPGDVITAGSGTSKTITDIEGGVFTFTVTNSSGCISAESIEVIISTPGVPELEITNPATVCSPNTINLTSADITAGSTPGLTYTYWIDSAATIPYATPEAATAGTYYIEGTTISGYFNIKPVIVTIDILPVSNAGSGQIIEYLFNTTMDAALIGNETGVWTLISGTGVLSDNTNPGTEVTGLSIGINEFSWKVNNGVCPQSSDTVKIVVHDLTIPTLITPNMDGRNDYFVLRGLETLGKTELIIFDRRGLQVYKNLNYDNSWNGVDYNENPLPEDTYYYILKAENGRSKSGYIVIRR